MVVMADSSARRLEDRLGNVLVKQGKITGARLDEALAVQKQTLQRLGHILASGSAITTKDLRDALSVQISQIVFRVFRWRDGRYQFAPAEAVDYDRENFVPMSTDFILMEGIRMVDEWHTRRLADAAGAAVDSAAVVGVGTMGTGIAQALLAAGVRVTLLDQDEATVQKGLQRIRGALEKRAADGKFRASGPSG